LNKPNDARKYFQRALELDPDNEGLRQKLSK
jgi:Tfp pilus assembly protein PilF